MSRTETCTFSNYRIYPYHGVNYVRIDGKVLRYFIITLSSLGGLGSTAV